jgi:hypothetical protein
VLAVSVTGAVLLALAGCSSNAQGPSTLAQQQQELKGGPIPPGAMEKYMATHHVATPPAGGQAPPPASK